MRFRLNLPSFSMSPKLFQVTFASKVHIGWRGRFSQLLRPSRKETENSKEEPKSSTYIGQLKKINKEKDQNISSLKQKILHFEKEKIEYLDDRSKLVRLYDIGLIDSAGDPLLADPPDDLDAENKEELMKF